MTPHDQILRWMNDPRLDSASVEPDRIDLIEALVKTEGWEPVLKSLLGILKDAELSKGWHDAMGVLWGGVLEKRPVDVDSTIALLHWCLERTPAIVDENLVWSITSKLKGVGYLSQYEPLQDPAVLREFGNLKGS